MTNLPAGMNTISAPVEVLIASTGEVALGGACAGRHAGHNPSAPAKSSNRKNAFRDTAVHLMAIFFPPAPSQALCCLFHRA